MHPIVTLPVNAIDADFKHYVLVQCHEALAAHGFTRFRKERVDWPLENGFHCWVGLNTAFNSTYVEINLFVGVHVVTIEKLWISMKKRKYPGKYDRGVATYGRHVGELSPNERVFRFTRQTRVDVEAKRLARLYATVGLTYAGSMAGYETLLPLLQERARTLGAYPERVASGLYLRGRADTARSFTVDFLAQHREYFEGFAVPFLRMLGRDGVH